MDWPFGAKPPTVLLSIGVSDVGSCELADLVGGLCFPLSANLEEVALVWGPTES